MAEMLVSTPELKQTIDEYDIVLKTGQVLPVVCNFRVGDTFKVGDTEILVNLVPKPSMNDPTKMLPAEDITIFKAHVVSIQHRTREIVELTPAQKAEWQKTFQELSGTLQ